MSIGYEWFCLFKLLPNYRRLEEFASFYVSETAANWYEARSRCKFLGGHLQTIGELNVAAQQTQDNRKMFFKRFIEKKFFKDCFTWTSLECFQQTAKKRFANVY